MVSSVHLSRGKNSLVSKVIFIVNFLLNLGYIEFGNPGISVNDCKVNIVGIDSMLLELMFLKILSTP